MEVAELIVNWFATNENGEEFASYTTGHHRVMKIEYHEPRGGGDKHYCDVFMENGSVMREFNLNTIIFKKEEQK